MPTRPSQLLLLLAALLSSLCCCRAGGWGAVAEMVRSSTAGSPVCCPLCRPENAPAPRHDSPCDQCPACTGATGTLPEAPVSLRPGPTWEIPAPLFEAEARTPCRSYRTPPVRTAHRPIAAGGRDVLRRHCALLI